MSSPCIMLSCQVCNGTCVVISYLLGHSIFIFAQVCRVTCILLPHVLLYVLSWHTCCPVTCALLSHVLSCHSVGMSQLPAPVLPILYRILRATLSLQVPIVPPSSTRLDRAFPPHPTLSVRLEILRQKTPNPDATQHKP